MYGKPLTNIGNSKPARGRSGFCAATCASSPAYVHAQSIALLPNRVADRAHALPLLVEHLVRPPSFGHADHRILKRRQAPTPHPPRSRATRRAHGPPGRWRNTLVSAITASGHASRRRSAQHGRLGDGPGHFGRCLPPNTLAHVAGFLARRARHRPAFSPPLRRPPGPPSTRPPLPAR